MLSPVVCFSVRLLARPAVARPECCIFLNMVHVATARACVCTYHNAQINCKKNSTSKGFAAGLELIGFHDMTAARITSFNRGGRDPSGTISTNETKKAASAIF